VATEFDDVRVVCDDHSQGYGEALAGELIVRVEECEKWRAGQENGCDAGAMRPDIVWDHMEPDTSVEALVGCDDVASVVRAAVVDAHDLEAIVCDGQRKD
jgi:L-alanine-DL-glutamate epimerase-like enolase superfamily enzyme